MDILPLYPYSSVGNTITDSHPEKSQGLCNSGPAFVGWCSLSPKLRDSRPYFQR